MLINAHMCICEGVCVLGPGRAEGIWHQTERNDGKIDPDADRTSEYKQFMCMSNNLNVNIAQ